MQRKNCLWQDQTLELVSIINARYDLNMRETRRGLNKWLVREVFIMTPSFEFFDVSYSRRAYFSAADQERAGYVAEITHGRGFQPAPYDRGIDLGAEIATPRLATVGMS
jgi:hypothetical protein